MFVRGITSGGLFVGYMRIDTGSTELSNSISAELSGSFGLFSAEANVKFKEVQMKYRNELTVDMYHEGGPTDLHLNNVEDPLELLRCVNEFLSSLANRPKEVAVPYAVTFDPLTIASGPLPPNEIDLQHAQDVLIFCAKRRSVLTDQLNTYQHIADFPERFDFSNGADLTEIRHAAENAQLDLDLISKCASHAMNNPGNAILPDTFATSVGESFPRLVAPKRLPNPIPIKPAEPKPNAMPNLVGSDARAVNDLWLCILSEGGIDHCIEYTQAARKIGPDARALAEFFDLVAHTGPDWDARTGPGIKWEMNWDPDILNNPSKKLAIQTQFPPPGVEVTPGSTIRLDCVETTGLDPISILSWLKQHGSLF